MHGGKDECCQGCCECSCHHGWGRRYYLRRFLVLVLGVVLAFWCGFKLGIIKGYMLGNGYYGFGRPMMGGYGMMRGWDWDDGYGRRVQVDAPAQPGAAPTATVTQ